MDARSNLMQAAQSLLEIASFLAMTFYIESHTIKARKDFML